jgi:flagellar biosynthesis chaperone FliJ
VSLTVKRLRRLERVRRLEEDARRQRFAAAAARLRRAEESVERGRASQNEMGSRARRAMEQGERAGQLVAEGIGGVVEAWTGECVAEREIRVAELEPEREAYVASRREREQAGRLAERAAGMARAEREKRAEREADEWSAEQWARERRRVCG